jgi:hypothetical protein
MSRGLEAPFSASAVSGDSMEKLQEELSVLRDTVAELSAGGGGARGGPVGLFWDECEHYTPSHTLYRGIELMQDSFFP